MKKNFNTIEELFSSTLGEEKIVVPASIKAGIDKGIAKKNGKGWLWFLILPFIAVLTFLLLPKTDKNAIKGNSELVIHTIPAKVDSTQETTSNFKSKSALNNSTLLLTNSQEPYLKDEKTKSITMSSSYLDKEDVVKKYKDEKTLERNELDLNDNKKFTTSSQIKIESPLDEKGPLLNTGIIPSLRRNEDQDAEINFSIYAPSTEEEPNKTLAQNTPQNQVSIIAGINSIPFGPIARIQLKKDEPLFPTTTIEPETKTRKGFWMVSGTAGYALNQANLSAEFTNITPHFTNNYDEKNGGDVELKGGYYFNRSFGVKSGISLTRFSENYTFTSNEWQYSMDSNYVELYEYIYDSSSVIIDSTDISYFEYLSDSTYINLYDLNGKNTAQIISLPFYLSYLFRFQRLLIEPEVFGAVNFTFNQSGTINPNNSLMNFDKSNPLYRKVFWSGGLGLNVHYHLNEYFLLSGYGRFQKPFGNLYSSTYSKTLNRFTFGGGISFVF